jgi:flagellar assembly protein FliH
METGTEWKVFESSAAGRQDRPTRIERMTYRAAGTMSVPAVAEPSGEPTAEAVAGEAAEVAKSAQLEERLSAAQLEATARVEAVRREGREALERERERAAREAATMQQAVAAEIAAALRSFDQERNEYFAQAEQEVVRLALAIAARILNREALLDPLLLSGAVRVALEQLGETTGVRLRCPAGQAEAWRERLRLMPNLPFQPEVVGDTALSPGDCRIEARIGSVDLGIRAQLEEIERGFFDLLERRPGAGHRAAGEAFT